MGDTIHYALNDPTAVEVDVALRAGAGAAALAAFQRDAVAVRAHWTALACGPATHPWPATFVLGESKRAADLEALRAWLGAHPLVRRARVRLLPNWRGAG